VKSWRKYIDCCILDQGLFLSFMEDDGPFKVNRFVPVVLGLLAIEVTGG
jgi:hypothetical protein